MGVKDGYWRAARARGALDGIALLRALEILGIDPRIFFIAAIGGQVGPGIFEAEFIHSAGISEEEVKRLLNDEG